MSTIINIKGREYILYDKGEDTSRNKYPHIVDRTSGQVPEGDQKAIMKDWLIQNGINIEPWAKRNTHWCIQQALRHLK